MLTYMGYGEGALPIKIGIVSRILNKPRYKHKANTRVNFFPYMIT